MFNEDLTLPCDKAVTTNHNSSGHDPANTRHSPNVGEINMAVSVRFPGNPFSAGTSKSDVHRHQMLKSKDDPRAERVKYL